MASSSQKKMVALTIADYHPGARDVNALGALLDERFVVFLEKAVKLEISIFNTKTISFSSDLYADHFEINFAKLLFKNFRRIMKNRYRLNKKRFLQNQP